MIGQGEVTRHSNPRVETKFLDYSGSMYEDLRSESLDAITELNFDGYAIGGLSVGENKEDMHRILEFTVPKMPKDSIRYLMGVGTPEDLVYAVSKGIDMFDCVMPTRNARNGLLFTRRGNVKIKNSKYKSDFPLLGKLSVSVCSPEKHGFNHPSTAEHIFTIYKK